MKTIASILKAVSLAACMHGTFFAKSQRNLSRF